MFDGYLKKVDARRTSRANPQPHLLACGLTPHHLFVGAFGIK